MTGFLPPLTAPYWPGRQRTNVYKSEFIMMSWGFHNRAWQVTTACPRHPGYCEFVEGLRSINDAHYRLWDYWYNSQCI